MKNSMILSICCWGISGGWAFGADQHWYEVDVTAGTSAKTFYGSSALDASGMRAAMASGQVIDLIDLSDNFAGPGESDVSWKRLPDEKEALIPSRNLICVIELPGDPVQIWARKK